MRPDGDGEPIGTTGGPLTGVRVIEMDAIGPVPYCALLLAGMGADIVHVARPAARDTRRRPTGFDPMRRGRPSVEVDLKSPEGAGFVRALARHADILIEGGRPGVMERLGLGPDILRADNPQLVYGRMTGWGQGGPLAPTAGHDINYIALTGALHAIGESERPVPPLNLVGDYGGGAMFLLAGILAGHIEARRTGRGQVVDAAMVDGAASLTTLFHGFMAGGRWRDERSANFLDGGAPWYGVYETADGRHVAVGAIEEPFWRALVERLGLSDLPPRGDRSAWPALRERLAAAFRTRGRDEWGAVFADTDACVTPVLAFGEASRHPHLVARGTFVSAEGTSLPAPAPRFERPPAALPGASRIGQEEALSAWER